MFRGDLHACVLEKSPKSAHCSLTCRPDRMAKNPSSIQLSQASSEWERCPRKTRVWQESFLKSNSRQKKIGSFEKQSQDRWSPGFEMSHSDLKDVEAVSVVSTRPEA